MAGQPASITTWVYGDGSGHFVNVWIRIKPVRCGKCPWAGSLTPAGSRW